MREEAENCQKFAIFRKTAANFLRKLWVLKIFDFAPKFFQNGGLLLFSNRFCILDAHFPTN